MPLRGAILAQTAGKDLSTPTIHRFMASRSLVAKVYNGIGGMIPHQAATIRASPAMRSRADEAVSLQVSLPKTARLLRHVDICSQASSFSHRSWECAAVQNDILTG